MILYEMKPKFLVVAALLASIAMLAMLGCSAGTDEPSGAGGSGDSAGNSDGSSLPTSVEIAAPIESVEIVKVAAKSPNASLVIVSGGLNSCESFKDYQLSRDGEVFIVQVTNLRLVGVGMPCTANYGTQEHSIELPSNEIAGCETYQVQVNGAMFSVQASCPAIATGPSAGEMVEALAPIVSAEVLALESFPVQYRLNIESALTNGCVEFGGYEVSREGETITVLVMNLVPADTNVVCTDDYRTVKNTLSLGTGLDYDAATTYTVNVNDVSTGFVTDAAAPVPTATGPGLGEAFDLVYGETVTLGSDGSSLGPSVKFVEVVEDSRCPSDVTCIWAGRALVRVIVSSTGNALGFGTVELTLEAGNMGTEGITVIGSQASYVVTFIELTPYPISTVELNSQDYVATMKVAKSD